MRRFMSTQRVSASAITIGVMFVLGALLTGIASAAPGNGNTTAPEQYAIVEFTDSPVAAYTGGIAGYPATEPLHGHKLDLASANVALYASYLHLRHASFQAWLSSNAPGRRSCGNTASPSTASRSRRTATR